MDNLKQIKRVLWEILILNWLVSFAKIIVGLMFNIISLTADGIHSLLDGASNIIGLVGLSISSKPADDRHPYGHAKFETFTSIFIGLMIIFAAFAIGKSSYDRVSLNTVPDISFITFIVIIITIGVNLFVTSYERKKGKELRSEILIADSEHTKTDLFASSLVFISLIVMKLGFLWIDLIASGIIVILIFVAGIKIILEGLHILSDQARIEPNLIKEKVLEIQGIKYCHRIRSRGSDGHILVDLHIGVSANMHIDKAHSISHQVADKLKKNLPQVKDVVVHTEPCK